MNTHSNHDDIHDDIEVELLDEETSPREAISRLKEKLKVCQSERQEYLDGWQRVKADIVNVNRRHEQERKEFTGIAIENFVSSLLPALDSFDMAFANQESWNKVDSVWRKGVEYIQSQLISALEQSGITTIDPVGQKFDPQQHHSLETLAVDTLEKDNIIIATIQKGYRMNERIIRPASVKVGHYEIK